jgi:hypothetical protein
VNEIVIKSPKGSKGFWMVKGFERIFLPVYDQLG